MASLEHLQQLGEESDLDDKSSSTSTSSSDESDDAPLASLRIPKPPKPPAAKKKPIKLKLSLSTKNKLPPPKKKKQPTPKSAVESDLVVEATVVDGNSSDVATDVVVEAEPVASNEKAAASSSVTPLKKRAIIRPVKIPPIPSPGLRFPHANPAIPNPNKGSHDPSGASASASDSNNGDGMMAPADLFNYHLQLAGYSEDRKHRGSSVRRDVGDMFDSDVTLALNFPATISKGLLDQGGEVKNDQDEEGATTKQDGVFDIIRRALQVTNGDNNASTSASRKRRRPLSFKEMVPVSLSIEWPEEYIEERNRYVDKVKEREMIIVEAQEAELEDLEVPSIPPIPIPPKAPRILNLSRFNVKDDHPYYPPKSEEMVKHLDRRCFHIAEGRYFGLLSNSISDPHFVGPLAPGWGGLTVTAVTGLATTQTGNTGAGSASLASTVYGTNPKEAKREPEAMKGNKVETTKKVTESVKKPKKVVSAANPSAKSTKSPKDGFSSSSKLKQLMEKGGDAAEEMRNCIIRAAVYASRTSRHGRPFVGSDGNKYPDVSKAFAAHGGIRPCNRCKNNKQGAYHCRLRRKHKELDYDGGDSPGKLAPLFAEDLENLIIQP